MASTPLADRPWDALPPESAAALRPQLPGLADEIIDAISHGVPEYARDLEGPFGQALRVGVEEALGQFVEMVERPRGGGPAGREVYVGLGRGEMRAGRTLDALLAAYRLGARVAWRRLAAAGEQAGLDPATLYLVAESIFAYIDEISAASAEGYAREQAAGAGELQRRRRRLAALLIQDPPPDAAAVEAEATAAGWALPRSLAAVAAAGDQPERLALRLGADAIAVVDGPGLCALVPDPDAPGRRAELERVAAERPLALGPTVAWPEAAVSAERARLAARLAAEGALGAPRGPTTPGARAEAARAARPTSGADGHESDGLVVAGDHALELVLHADRRLTGDLAARALAPFAEETAASQARLEATLTAWLRHRGRTEAVAEALHVHPQTVRYRLGRLRDLFGDRLEDPDARFELELALRWRAGTREPA